MFLAAMLAFLTACSGDYSKGDTEKRGAKAESAKEKKAEGHSDAGKDDHDDDKKGHGAAIKLSETELDQAGVKVEQLAEESVRDKVQLTATIQANQERMAHVAARVPGRIVKVNAALGQRVSGGQALAVLDSLEVGEARSVYRQAQSEAELARADFDRYEKLYKEKIVPQKEWLRARSQLEKSQAALRAAADKLKMLGTSADGQGSVFPVNAPFGGIIINRKAVVGELAEPKDMLFTVADLHTVWIEANLFERDLGRVKVGSEAMVTVSAYPDETFQGRLTYISSMLDRETRTARARIEVPNPDERLKLEMFATVVLGTETQRKALVVPEEAVVLIDNKPSVYIEHSGSFEAKAIDLGEKLRGRVVVNSGLKPGDRVVVAGAYELKARQLKSQLGAGHGH